MIPRQGTRRNFDNPTSGAKKALVARMMGQPFMPWQQYVADVMGEVDPRTGVKVYREGYVSTMRQVGKTTYVVVEKASTALDTSTPVWIQFAAQEGKSAIAKMIKHAEMIKATPLGRMLADGTPTTSNAKEHVTWANGSQEWPLTEKESSGHGDTVALGAITEAFAHRDDRYIQTMQPAMNTNPNAQLLVESTHGTAASLYWNEQTKELSDRYEADPAELSASRIAWFNYSFAADDDPFSPATWRTRIPSIGHTLRLEEVEHAARNATTPRKVRAFLRGFGNIADLGAGESAAIDEDAWEASGTDSVIVGARAFMLDITPDQSWASIAWSGLTAGGTPLSEVVKHERSRHWVLPYFGDLFDRNPRAPRRVYVVAGGQAALMADRFNDAGIEMIILPRAEYAAAAAEYYDGITDPKPSVLHRMGGQTVLDIAVGGAQWTRGNAPRIWDPIRSSTVISPLVAVSIGPWAFNLEQARTDADYDVLDSIA